MSETHSVRDATAQSSVLPDRVDVQTLEPGEETEADKFVFSSPSGMLFHLSGWRSVVRASLGHRSFCLVARRGGQITGTFPLSLIRNRLFGDCLVSLPLAVYGGICADDSESYFSLLRAAGNHAERLGVKYVEMRNRTEPYSTDLPSRKLYVTFTQDLTPGSEKLLRALPRDTRYAIRKSQKAGLEWTEDLTESEFYDIYAHSVHRLGTPVFPRKLFTSIRSEFPKRYRLFGVRKGPKAIAGVLCLYFKDQVLPYYGGALIEFVKDCPNNFMYWNLIVQSCAEGYRTFDFGRTKRGTGSFDFKSSWSMRVSDLPYRYQLVRAREIPLLSPVDRRFQLPVMLWKKLPFACTKLLGPRLIRWIPSV
jgi:FemAB-related protein (PEP-CTERM system-associated)